MEEKTGNLQKELNKNDLESYLNSHSFDDFASLNFSLTLKTILEEKSLKPADIVKGSNLAKSYVYAILSGKKTPSRNKVLAIAISIGANVDECNTLLKSSSFRFLHPKSKKDSIIIYSLNKGYSLTKVNIELEKSGSFILD